MRTVQMTFDDDLLKKVDRAARELKTSRSAFTRTALFMALAAIKMQSLEKKHRAGYLKHPAKADEFSAWEDEQTWID